MKGGPWITRAPLFLDQCQNSAHDRAAENRVTAVDNGEFERPHAVGVIDHDLRADEEKPDAEARDQPFVECIDPRECKSVSHHA